MPDRPVDVVVIGGGPAGSAAARLLAESGHDVVVLTGPGGRASLLAESLPPSCRKLLARLGALEKIEAAGFVRSRGNSSAWGGNLRSLPFEGGLTGFQVARHRFDELLLTHAAAAGARVFAGAAARDVSLPSEAGDPGTVRWASPDGGGALTASWILDASGRAGVIARRGFRHRATDASTLALAGFWSHPGGWPMDDESHTIVESYADGWVWSVPVADGRRIVTAMIDPRVTALARGRGIDAMYQGELAKTRHLRAILDRAESTGGAWACNASPYGAIRHSAPGVFLVGDAGSFLDPLSSFGVKKALASGWLAAVATHTALVAPERAGAAAALFEERERAAERAYHGQTARYYAEAAGVHDHPYWRTRADGAATTLAAPGTDDPEADSERLLRHPGLRTAFEYLYREEPLRLRPTPGLRREPRPTVEGREVVVRDHLIGPGLNGGVHSIRGVRVTRLIDIVGHHERVPDLYEAYSRDGGPAGLPEFLSALSALLAAGLLEGVPNN